MNFTEARRHAQASLDGAAPRLPPLSLYLHIPWCLQKCPYCDFNSHPVRNFPEGSGRLDRGVQLAYVNALLADLTADLPWAHGRPLQTLYLGGGTPSLLDAEVIDYLLRGIRNRCEVAQDAEITLEANPGAADQERFHGFRAAGINRLSIGIQSFQDDRLRALGRVHDGAAALAAVAAARAAGFDNLNLDLMYGLPGQDPAGALTDLTQALALQPEHLSHYQLTIEPNTGFAAAPPPQIPDDDSLADIQDQSLELAQAAGYQAYEIAALAKPGAASRHNLNYWNYGDYLGIGAGAHGKVTDLDNRVWRYAKVKHPTQYRAAVGPERFQSRERVDAAHLPGDFLLNALRLHAGVPRQSLAQRDPRATLRIAPIVNQAIQDGLMVDDPERYVATPLGLRFLNDLLLRFLDESA